MHILSTRGGRLLVFSVANVILAFAIVIEARPEPLTAFPSPEMLLALRLWRRPVAFEGRILICVRLHALLCRALHQSGLRVVCIAFGAVIALLVIIAVLAVRPASLLLELLIVGLRRSEYPQIVLGVLEIAFRHDGVAGSKGIAAKLKIFVCHGLRGTAHLHVWPVALIDAV